MENFTFTNKYGSYDNCYFETGVYENGNLAISIYSAEEGPIIRVTVNPDLIIPFPYIAIKDYSENEGMVSWLISQELIEDTPATVLDNSYVTIPVYKLSDKDIEVFRRDA